MFIRNKFICSDKDDTAILWGDLLNSPVIKVIVQVTISHAKLELLHELTVLLYVKSVIDIIALVLSKDECISSKLEHAMLAWDIIVRIGNIEDLVFWMFQNTRWQRIE